MAFATETVYGLGADAFNEQAVARVFDAKNRPHFDPLIVHIADEAWLHRLVPGFPEVARTLADHFWPGPLTMVLPKTDEVPDLVTSGLPSVAVRMPAHAQARQLLRKSNIPIAAPSANPFGRISPTTAEHVAESLGNSIDLILDGGPCDVGIESTVIDLCNDMPRLLRHGGVTLEQIQAVLGPIDSHPISETSAAPSPGMLPQHYAPRTPMIIASDLIPEDLAGKRVGGISLTDEASGVELSVHEVLSRNGDLNEAAAGFFAALRRLDTATLDLIVAWPFPDERLGRALNDRLQRACHS